MLFVIAPVVVVVSLIGVATLSTVSRPLFSVCVQPHSYAWYSRGHTPLRNHIRRRRKIDVRDRIRRRNRVRARSRDGIRMLGRCCTRNRTRRRIRVHVYSRLGMRSMRLCVRIRLDVRARIGSLIRCRMPSQSHSRS